MVYTQDQIEPTLQAVYDTIKKSGVSETKITEILDIYRKLLTDNVSGVPVVESIATALTAFQEKNINPTLNKATLIAIVDYIGK